MIEFHDLGRSLGLVLLGRNLGLGLNQFLGNAVSCHQRKNMAQQKIWEGN